MREQIFPSHMSPHTTSSISSSSLLHSPSVTLSFGTSPEVHVGGFLINNSASVNQQLEGEGCAFVNLL